MKSSGRKNNPAACSTKPSPRKRFRVPPPKPHPLPGIEGEISVNHCKMPGCANFGEPASSAFEKPGPSAGRDPRYVVQRTNKGCAPALRCKSCGEKPPIRSNQGIADELRRLAMPMLAEMDLGCPNAKCDNHGKGVLSHPGFYLKRGERKSGGGSVRCCRACRRKFTFGGEPPVRVHRQNRHLASDLMSRIINKSPLRRALVGMDRRGRASLYYTLLRFIRARSNRILGATDAALMAGAMRLPPRLNLEVDLQEYRLNWTNRMDRRNPVFSSIATVDTDSRYIFGLHCNYDPDADGFAINQDAAKTGDMLLPEAFRRRSQYWLAGDELHAGRVNQRRLGREQASSLRQEIARIYAAAQTREDIEDGELAKHDITLCDTSSGAGLQVHIPYTAYAHFFLMREMLNGAGVGNACYAMDCDSMLRAVFLSAFRREVKAGAAHAFYVKSTKFLPQSQRETLKQEANRRLENYRRALPPPERPLAALYLMADAMKDGAEPFGRWRDRWATHPRPTMNEPEKAVCWLTPDKMLHPLEAANMSLDATLGAVDNVFQLIRRLVNPLERPLGTSSGYATVWHGYAPYNPAMVQAYLDVFRCAHNFCITNDKAETPAMRLGLADRALSYNDVLWPGQMPPQVPRRRRNAQCPFSGLQGFL